MADEERLHESAPPYGALSVERRLWEETFFPRPTPPRAEASLTADERGRRLRTLLQGDLDFHGRRDGSPLHTLHPFPAKYPPQLPRLFIEQLTAAGERVLDPMMGSGTTLLEAHRLGRVALGTDIDPLALQLTAAKLEPPSVEGWNAAHEQALRRAAILLQDEAGIASALARFDPPTRAFADYWFLPQTQRELMALALAIEEEPKERERRFLRILFSSLIIAKSGSVAQARDLSHTRPHKVARPPKPTLTLFRQKAQRIGRLLAKLPPRRQAAPYFLGEADAQRLPFAEGSIALIVTSPPYAANAIDYMRAHKFSLIWWGYPIRQLGALRGDYIGGEALRGAVLEPLPAEAEAAIQSVAEADAKKGKVLHRYFSEMRRVLREMHRLLQPGGIAIVVVGDSTMRGRSTRTPDSLAAIGEQIGLRCVGIGERRLDRNRRMMPARQGAIGSSIEQRMHVEYVLGFQK